MASPDGHLAIHDRVESAFARRKVEEAKAAEEHKAKIEQGLGYVSTIDEVLGDPCPVAEADAKPVYRHHSADEIDHLLGNIDTLLANSTN